MKQFLLALSIALASSAALADSDYVGGDYQHKSKNNTTEYHDVFGLAAGHKFSNGFGLELRMEDEVVNNPSKHEGLVQGRVSYDLPKVSIVTPYLAGAVGYKSKATTNFNYYVAEVGLKADITDKIMAKLTSRLRTPFNESEMGSGYLYRTIENSATLGYRITKNDVVSVKYAHEHGDSNYHTWGVSLVHNF